MTEGKKEPTGLPAHACAQKLKSLSARKTKAALDIEPERPLG
jgi:hypothetical protein